MDEPVGPHQLDVLAVGHDVEPVPAAVDEGHQVEVDADVVDWCPAQALEVDHLRGHLDRGTSSVRPIDHDGGRAAHLRHETHLVDRGPAPPVGRGEGVEVGREGHPLAGADLDRPSGGDVEDAVGRVLVVGGLNALVVTPAALGPVVGVIDAGCAGAVFDIEGEQLGLGMGGEDDVSGQMPTRLGGHLRGGGGVRRVERSDRHGVVLSPGSTRAQQGGRPCVSSPLGIE